MWNRHCFWRGCVEETECIFEGWPRFEIWGFVRNLDSFHNPRGDGFRMRWGWRNCVAASAAAPGHRFCFAKRSIGSSWRDVSIRGDSQQHDEHGGHLVREWRNGRKSGHGNNFRKRPIHCAAEFTSAFDCVSASNERGRFIRK
jgi:hypothetical protein